VPTPVSHAAVGYALGAWTQRPAPARRVCIAAAACAALPDIDVVAGSVAHRGITHSFAFALVVAIVVTAIFFRDRPRVVLLLGLAALSHLGLDELSSYSNGLALLAPFSWQRYRCVWTPLGGPGRGLWAQLLQETLVVLLPAVLVAWLGTRRSQPRT